MKANIFSIPPAEVDLLEDKLIERGMSNIHSVEQDGWSGKFYYSKEPQPAQPGWADTFRTYFGDEVELPTSRNHYAAFMLTKGDRCYVLSFGKSHFYIRPYCDYDFGIELAKRIANESDTRQTASRRFQGRRRKDIKSFTNNSRLDVESGESVDFIQSGIIEGHTAVFGKSGKFGTSALLTPDIVPSEIGVFLTRLDDVLAEPALFPLPRTTLVTEDAEAARFDELLLDELTSEIGTTEFLHNTYDLYGVDFIFSNAGTFSVTCPSAPKRQYESLSMADLKRYIQEYAIPRDQILKIKIKHEPEGSPAYTQKLKEAIDFIPDEGNRVMLTNGRWVHFNQDYLDFLDEYLQGITVEEAEPEFADIIIGEPEFNASEEIAAAGYTLADKDFKIFRTRQPTPIEAWDLKKGTRVYAVKFGVPQKLNYVIDQATNVLELLRNRAGVTQVPEFESYCLWIGYRAQGRIDDISKSGSIILKQKIEAWARKCRDLQIEPVIKISRKLKKGVDTPSN